MAGKKKQEDSKGSSRKLRAEAEKKVTLSASKSAPLKKQDLDKLVHELRVHQEELEMQNEELQRTQAELAASQERYFKLYDIAPVGYFSIHENGTILEANLTGANLLGAVPGDLRAKRITSYIYKEDQDVYYLHRQQLLKTLLPQVCEIRMVRKDGSLFWARIEASIAQDAKSGKPVCLCTISDITGRKKAEDQRYIALEKYRVLFESFPLGITITDTAGNIVEANEESGRLLGLTVDKQLKRKYDGPEWRIVRPDGSPMPPGEFASVRALTENRRIENVEMGIVKNSGEITWINVTAEPVPLADFGVAVTYSDISARKQAEEALRESEQKYHTLVAQSPDGIFIVGLNGNFLSVNRAMYENLNYSEKELLSMNIWDIVPAEYVDLHKKRMADIFLGKALNAPAEYAVKGKDGNLYYVEILSAPYYEGKELVGFQGIARDITARKHAEDDLRDSEAQYRLLSEHTTDFVWLMDMDLKPTYQSPSAEKLTGFTQEELMQLPFEKRVTPESLKLAAEVFLKEIPRVMADQGYNPVFSLELEIYRRDGTTLWSDNKFSVIRDPDGKPVSILGEARDITEHKQAERRIKESEMLYRSLIETSPDAIGLMDLNGNIIMYNKQALELFGFELTDDLMGKNIMDMVAPENYDAVLENMGKLQKAEVIRNWELTSFKKDRQPFYLELSSSMLFDEEGKPKSIMAVFKDITGRKLAEDALKASEVQYRLLAEHMTDIVWMMNMDLNVTWLSPSAVKARGFSVDEIIALPLDRQLTPKSLEKAVNWLGKLMRLEKDGLNPEPDGTLSRELEFYCKDGHIIVLDCAFQFIRDKQGKATSILAEGKDVTALHESEKKLTRIHQQNELILGTVEEGIIGLDLQGNHTFVNPAAARMLGYEVEELLFRPSHSTWHHTRPDGSPYPQEECEIYAAFRTGVMHRVYNEVFWRKDGSSFPVEYASMPVYEHGGLAGAVVAFADITERNQKDKALKVSEAQYRLLSEHMTDTVWLMDMNLKTTYQSPSVQKVRGFTPQEIEDMPLEKHLTTESLKIATDAFLAEMAKIEADPNYDFVITLDLEFYCKNGTTLWSENTFSLIRDENGRPQSILGEGRDITERRLMGESLKDSEAKYRLLADNTVDGIWLLDMNLKLLYCSPASEKQSGFTLQEIMGMSLEQYFTPESLKIVAETFLEAMPKAEADRDYNPVLTLDLEFYKKDGASFWAECKFSIIRDEHGKPVNILGMARDISERKLAEEKLEKSYESLKKTLNDAINTMVKIVEMRDPYTAGHQQKVAELATAIAREMKLEDNRVERLRMAAVIHDIGKMYIPSDILSRPGKLSDMEFNLIKTHSQGGYDIEKSMDFPCAVAKAVLQHHERLDGSGYPNRLKGVDTLLEAKILAVADVVEAMASDRPYRPSLGIDKALEEISKNKGILYDPDVVDACGKLFADKEFSFTK